jgi:hypothetical protein
MQHEVVPSRHATVTCASPFAAGMFINSQNLVAMVFFFTSANHGGSVSLPT